MATEQNLILNMPFDEADGSAVAYDYTAHRYDATVEGATFKHGTKSNCIHFEGTGSASVEQDILQLASDFTILAWVKPSMLEDGVTGKRLGLFCNTGLMEGYRDVWVDVNPDVWQFVIIRKSSSRVSLIIDLKEQGSVTLPGTLTGLSLLQDVYSGEYAYADLDEVKIYNTALSNEELEEAIKSVSTLEYILDGVNLKDFGIRVSASTGVLDLPKLKSPTEVDWPDYHGKVLDLTDKRYSEREITLSCWCKATGKSDFAERIYNLCDHFRKDGTIRLEITINPLKPLVYEVYNEDGVAVSKKWHDEQMIGTFTLKLQEPDPVKRVMRHQYAGSSTKEVSVAFKSDKMVNIYWGDGTVEQDVYGDHTGENAITHSYETTGVYYVIVAGVIEEITDFNTNGIVIWSRL